MAAAPDAQVPELVDLWQVSAEDLEPLLEEETRAWREQLDWDFQASADLVRRFVAVHGLNGYALLLGDEPIGYAYFVSEEHKALIGDLYVREGFRTARNEHRLLEGVVDHLVRARYVRRIESQLMAARSLEHRLLPAARFARPHLRSFMIADLFEARRLPERFPDHVLLDQWTERRQDETAQLIAAAYRGHIDSEINDQYRSAAGARRFLFNIIQYPGCGTFYAPASWIAVHAHTGRICGVCLASKVAPHVGHITQVCVAPNLKGQGVGYELMRHSMLRLAESGARRVSLTVTAANRNAVQLYERMGFRLRRQFPALVWEGF